MGIEFVQLNANAILTDESLEEVNKLMNSRDFYVSPAGMFMYDVVIDTHEYLLRALTIGN